MELVLKTILLYVPTSYLEAYVTLRMLSLSSNWRRLCVYAAIQGCIMGTVRDVLGLLCPHILILVSSSVVVSILVLKVSLQSALIMRALALFFVAIGELLLAKPIFARLGFSPEETLSDWRRHVVAGWIGTGIVVVLACYFAMARHVVKTVKERSHSY